MSSAILDRGANIVSGMTHELTNVCLRCQTHYNWKKSSSAYLKMTYCGVMCERADIGCTIEDILNARLKEQPLGD